MWSFFKIHSREQRGVAWLCLLIAISIGFNIYLSVGVASKPLDYYVVSMEPNKKTAACFYFDPNTITKDSLRLLGLNEVLCKQWINYRNKVGDFVQHKDLKKLYAMNDSVYTILEPMMVFATKPIKPKQTKSKVALVAKKDSMLPKTPAVYSKTTMVDINLAGIISLQKIKGVGGVFAKRIVKYRNQLGGFVRMEQLKEVYGITDEVYQQMVTQCIFSTKDVRKIDVNHCETKDLSMHPYINWHQANAIVKYRNMHGCYVQAKDITKSVLIGDLFFEKLNPYLQAGSCE